MELIPAIDIINGKCVRLHQGDYNRLSQYSEDLSATAKSWRDQGAKWLHLVDLDGAKSGNPDNFDCIRQIIETLPTLNIEVGGGIRNQETVISYLRLGVKRVIIGSQAVRDPLFFSETVQAFPNRIALGLDARDGLVMTHGWLEGSHITTKALITKFSNLPLAAIIYTDIARDGTLTGVNLDSTLELAQQTDIPVFASGGVSGITDIIRLGENRKFIAGVILGKSLYEGKLNFAEALAYLEQNSCLQKE